MPGRHPQPRVGVSATHERAGEVTKHPRVYELKIRGVASDLVRAEFDDVELWEARGAIWLRCASMEEMDCRDLFAGVNKLDRTAGPARALALLGIASKT
jgi:hypothetical protein